MPFRQSANQRFSRALLRHNPEDAFAATNDPSFKAEKVTAKELEHIVILGYVAVFEHLIGFRPIQQEAIRSNEKLLNIAAMQDHAGIVRSLLAHDSIHHDEIARGIPALRMAAIHASQNVLAVFLEYDSIIHNITYNSNQAFNVAIWRGNLPSIALFLGVQRIRDAINLNDNQQVQVLYPLLKTIASTERRLENNVRGEPNHDLHIPLHEKRERIRRFLVHYTAQGPAIEGRRALLAPYPARHDIDAQPAHLYAPLRQLMRLRRNDACRNIVGSLAVLGASLLAIRYKP